MLFTPRANTTAASLITHTVWIALPLTLSQHLFSISTVGEVSPMNPVERVLHQELTGLLDRLATSVPAGGFETIRGANPTLKTRLDDADAKLAAVRESLLDSYGRWRRALEDLENLWALGAWRSTAAEEASEQSAALAA
ncbi:MAG TPA: hypothetical protein VJZ73_01685 [Methylomirabilota bacterium]|nr:hypothetical protein [Methylomirabilota bacterium]